MANWNQTAQVLPKEGVVVDTLSDNGLEQKLKREGKLWFHSDGSMYVYYTPKFWKDSSRLDYRCCDFGDY